MQRLSTATVIATAGVTPAASPAFAGVWVASGLQQVLSDRQATGHGRKLTGQHQTCTCTAERDSVAPRNFYRLRGHMN